MTRSPTCRRMSPRTRPSSKPSSRRSRRRSPPSSSRRATSAAPERPPADRDHVTEHHSQGNGLPMPSSTMLRNRYVSDSVETMSPGRLIVALYDRALLDLDRARVAIEANDVSAAHDALVHAQ